MEDPLRVSFEKEIKLISTIARVTRMHTVFMNVQGVVKLYSAIRIERRELLRTLSHHSPRKRRCCGPLWILVGAGWVPTFVDPRDGQLGVGIPCFNMVYLLHFQFISKSFSE